MTGFLNPTVAAELIALVAGILVLGNRCRTWFVLILLLAVTVLIEFAGWYWSYVLRIRNNTLFFNVELLISTVVYIWLLSRSELLHKDRRTAMLLLLMNALFWTCNLLFWQGTQQYNSYSDILADATIAGFCCTFFYRLVMEEEYRNIYAEEFFWLAAGLLVYAMGSLLLYFFTNELDEYYRLTKVNLWGYFNYGINIFMYGCFIIAFICRRKTLISSLELQS